MVDPGRFSNLALPNGIRLTRVVETDVAMIDPMGRTALAKTAITGREMIILLVAGLDEREKSISLYHEILEGLTVAVRNPPQTVTDFVESDFEAAAITAHERFGFADPEKVIMFLRIYGFGAKSD